MHNFVQIIINGVPTNLGTPLPTTVTSLSIQLSPVRVFIPRAEVPQVTAWLIDLRSRLTCTHILLNQTLVPVSDLPT